MEKKRNYFDLMIYGIGGQGNLFIGRLLAESALTNYKYTTFLQNHGIEMRTQPCECTVVISDEEITSPVTTTPETVIMMGPWLEGFEGNGKKFMPGSMLIIDSSMMKADIKRKGVKVVPIPATRTAIKLGNQQVTNLVLLGSYLEISKVLPVEVVEQVLEKRMAGGRRQELLALNKQALREGAKLASEEKAKEKVSAS